MHGLDIDLAVSQGRYMSLDGAEDPGVRAADVGADGYIAKPFDLDVLIERGSAFAHRSSANEASA